MRKSEIPVGRVGTIVVHAIIRWHTGRRKRGTKASATLSTKIMGQQVSFRRAAAPADVVVHRARKLKRVDAASLTRRGGS